MTKTNDLARRSRAAIAAVLAWIGLVSGGCATTTTERLGLPPLETVPEVDLSRYIGTWYEIASYPKWFQKGCTGTTATYSLGGEGEIRVVNRCRKGSLQGKDVSARGRARVTDAGTNARLEVSFFRPFWGDYWIIDLDEDYEYAVVGTPDRDSLWILSRAPIMEESVYAGILDRLRGMGYPLDRLNRTLQPGSADASPRTMN